MKQPLALLSGSLNAAGGWKSPFVEKVKGELGLKATYREVIEADGTYALREAAQTYGLDFAGKSEPPKHPKHALLDLNPASSDT
jgi:hypothetical protein